MVTDNSSGEMFCGNCGFVVTERIEETGPEWRAFSKEEHEDRSRAGIPTSLAMHDMGLATIIGPVDKDASGMPHLFEFYFHHSLHKLHTKQRQLIP